MRFIRSWVAVPFAAALTLTTLGLAEAPASASDSVVGTYNFYGSTSSPGIQLTFSAGGVVTDNIGDTGTWTSVRRSVEAKLGGCTLVGITHPLAINSKGSQGSYTCGGGVKSTWYARMV